LKEIREKINTTWVKAGQRVGIFKNETFLE